MEETQAEGVTQGTEAAPASAEDSAPESIVSGESQEGEQNADGEGNPAPKSKEYNFKQLREQVNRLEAERNKWAQERESLSGAAQLDKFLRSDPKNLEIVMAMMNKRDIRPFFETDKPKNDLPEIDFEKYEPETAKLLKFLHARASKIDEIEQWKANFEQKYNQSQEEVQKTHVQNNMESLDNLFEQRLKKDGFLDAQGNGDLKVLKHIEKSLLVSLAELTQDPRLATKEQFEQAYNEVLDELSAHQKLTLKKTVKTEVPLSGSRKGSIPMGKSKMTEEERISSIVNSLGG